MPILPYARLLRVPNVFTAMADICLGALVTGALPAHVGVFILLLLSSSSLYLAGMVWNDYFDVEQDRRERSFRPLPSGAISMKRAMGLGVVLMVVGCIAAALADLSEDGFRWQSFPLALALSAAILLYDGALKKTWLGPVAMGICRALNVLLGLTASTQPIGTSGLVLAAVVGIYIVGVTWFARTEARDSNRNNLRGATGVMAASLVLSLAVPVVCEECRYSSAMVYPYLLAAFAMYIGWPLFRAIERPAPASVQSAVKRAVLGLVLLDAVLATSIIGPEGLVIVSLLLPATILGRWVYST